MSPTSDAPTPIQDHVALFQLAMDRLLAVPTILLEALEQGPHTGRLPPRDQMLQWMNPQNMASTTWDGTVDGHLLWDAEEVLWCTLRDRYGWGLPCAESLDAISSACQRAGRLVEVGAGTGYWAAVLRARGIDVLAVDSGAKPQRWSRTWGGVTKMTGEHAIADNPRTPVLVCWPDPQLGDRLLRTMACGNVLMRTGPRQLTGGQRFNDRIDEAFDPVSSVPSLCASGGPDVFETLVRNASLWTDSPASTGRWESPIMKVARRIRQAA